MIDYPPGFTCDRIALLLERYLSSTLPRGDELSTAEHLEACPWCIERLVLLRMGRAP